MVTFFYDAQATAYYTDSSRIPKSFGISRFFFLICWTFRTFPFLTIVFLIMEAFCCSCFFLSPEDLMKTADRLAEVGWTLGFTSCSNRIGIRVRKRQGTKRIENDGPICPSCCIFFWSFYPV